MTFKTFNLWLASILVGLLLGLFGAAAAHYFRVGILFIENYSAKNLPASKIRRFFDLDKTTTVGKDVVKSIHKKKRKKRRKKHKKIRNLIQ
jgi:hypothetical protein